MSHYALKAVEGDKLGTKYLNIPSWDKSPHPVITWTTERVVRWTERERKRERKREREREREREMYSFWQCQRFGIAYSP